MVKHLNFNGCKKLEDIPEALQNLNALESLILRGCNSLFSFPGNGFRGITSLMHGTHLEEFCPVDCPTLDSLPAEIQRLSALRMLTISWCNGLTSVPNQIEHLTSLSKLKLESCPNLLGLQLSFP